MLSESVNQRLQQAHRLRFPSKDAGFVVIPMLQHYYACLWCPRGKVPPSPSSLRPMNVSCWKLCTPVLMAFLMGITKCLTTRLQGGRVHLARGHGPSGWGRHDSRSGRQLLTRQPQSGSREMNWTLCSAHFLFSAQSRTSAHGMVPPTFRVGLPS